MKFKAIAYSFACAILCVSYIAAIVGIDVHFDSHNGRTYVVSLLSGTGCEDIHEDDHCLCGHCEDCNHAEGICHADKDCSDAAVCISLTGSESNKILIGKVSATAINSFHETPESFVHTTHFIETGRILSGQFKPIVTQLRI